MTTPRYDVAELGCGLPRLVPPPLLLPWEQESPSHPSISAHLLSTAWLSFASGVGSLPAREVRVRRRRGTAAVRQQV